LSRLSAVLSGFALLAGMLISGAVMTAPAALAYQGCNTTSSANASPSSADAGQPIDFTVTIRDCNGNGLVGANVTFGQQSGPAGCTATFTPSTAKTDANGVAQTTVSLPAGCPCQYVLSASGGGVTVTTTVRENGCLPFTAGQPSAAVVPGGIPPMAALLAAAGAVLLGLSAAYLVRTRQA
jgi:hypothetical protein